MNYLGVGIRVMPIAIPGVIMIPLSIILLFSSSSPSPSLNKLHLRVARREKGLGTMVGHG